MLFFYPVRCFSISGIQNFLSSISLSNNPIYTPQAGEVTTFVRVRVSNNI